MSQNRENVTWQSKDNSWNIGFYDYSASSGDEEWDVDYTDNFYWASTGHPTAQSARKAWQGANPGGGQEMAYTPGQDLAIARLDDEATKTYLAMHDKTRNHLNQYPTYSGAPRKRNIVFVAEDLYKAKLEVAGSKLFGYLKSPDERMSTWAKELADADLSKLSETDLASLDAKAKNYATGLKEMAARARPHRDILRNWMAPVDRVRMNKRMDAINEAEEEAQFLLRAKPVEITAPAKPITLSENPTKAASNVRYHVSPKTGRPNLCSATIRGCPFASEADHYSTKVDARKAFEAKMGSGLGQLKK